LKHVFVETNFIVEVVRPSPSPDALKLLGRQGKDVELHVPWAALVESKRTLERIIREDLGFDAPMLKRAARELKAAAISKDEMRILQQFVARTKGDREKALKAIAKDVDAAAAKMSMIEPSKEVIAKTLSLYQVKSLPPFDEMIMGAVLTRAETLWRKGETALYFCNLNKDDFDPTNRPTLTAEYASCGLTYLPSFRVPR
jgi:hypothetical protein